MAPRKPPVAKTPHRSRDSSMRKLVSRIVEALTVVMRAALWFVLIAFIDEVLPTLDLAPQTHVSAKLQRVALLNEPLPTADSLPSPLPGQHLTDTWGAARGQGRRHEGIDIFAKRGTPILATTQGIVSKVGNNTLGGRVVVIIGPGGAGHYYAHLQDYAQIAVNDWVEAGEVIGYVGNSGNAKGTPPHVHYGIYINGRAVNPYPLLIKPS